MRLINPGTYKSEAFEALIKMMEANLITFPSDYDNKGYLNMLEVDEKVLAKHRAEVCGKLDKMNLSKIEYEEQLEEEMSKLDIGKVKVRKLSIDEEIALKQVDALKEETVNIIRVKRDSGKDSFKLPPYKDAETGASEATLHDDRVYCLALAGFYLQEKRLEHIRKRKRDTNDLDKFFEIKRPKSTHSYFG
jgi:hypothetical protein